MHDVEQVRLLVDVDGALQAREGQRAQDSGFARGRAIGTDLYAVFGVSDDETPAASPGPCRLERTGRAGTSPSRMEGFEVVLHARELA